MHVEGNRRGVHLNQVGLPLGGTLAGYQDTLTLPWVDRCFVDDGREGKGVLGEGWLHAEEGKIQLSFLHDGQDLGNIAHQCAHVPSLFQLQLHQYKVPHLKKN